MINMKDITKVAIVEGIKIITTNEAVGRFICGTYSDGSQRSFSDCISGEYLSPKEKLKMIKKAEKRKRKKNAKKYY